MLRSLFSGIYTVDNMDFVLRDAYMSGYSARAFDLERLLHYSFFSRTGLTIHARGLPALVRFIGVRAELFRTIYFHRTVRAIDLTLADLFADSKALPVPRQSAGTSGRVSAVHRVVAAGRRGRAGRASDDPREARAGPALGSDSWPATCPGRWPASGRVFFDPAAAERSSIFSSAPFFEQALREQLPAALQGLPLRVDLARHVHRPGTRGPAAGQNFLYDPAPGLDPRR